MKNRFFAILSLVLILCTLAGAAVADAPFRAWNKADSYQYVIFGSYPMFTVDHVEKNAKGKKVTYYTPDDPVVWQVLDAFEDEGVAWLLTAWVMDVHKVIDAEDKKSARMIEDFEDSDLFAWMNSEMVDTMFTAEEQAVLDTSRGKLFLPTNVEYIDQYGFPKTIQETGSWDRMCDATAYAISKGIYRQRVHGATGATYWCVRLRPSMKMMQIVGFDGHESWAGWTRKDVGVRPAIRVRMDMVDFVSGSGTKDDPYVMVPRSAN